MKRCIIEFEEPMKHEFPRIKETITACGFKVDGKDGIKLHCQLNKLKSVDYFYLKDSKYVLVEFSDLARQKANLIEDFKQIKEAELSYRLKRTLQEEIFKKIQTELASKYKDSIYIIDNMESQINNIPPLLLNKKNGFLIIVAPIDKNLTKGKQGDISRFLEALKDKVSNSLPDNMYSSVKLLPVSKLLQ